MPTLRASAAIALAATATPIPALYSPLSFSEAVIEAVADDRDHDPDRAPGPPRVVAPLAQVAAADYADGVGAVAGPDRPIVRALSHALNVASLKRHDTRPLSNLAVAFSQLHLSHDVAHGPTIDDMIDTPVPADDPIAETVAGTPVMVQRRSAHTGGSGLGDPRMPINAIAQFFDASVVYGRQLETEALLRSNDGTGRLKTGPVYTRLDPDDPLAPLIDGVTFAGPIDANTELAASDFGTSPFLAPIAPVPLPQMLPPIAVALAGLFGLSPHR